jgi:hypothetical protein
VIDLMNDIEDLEQELVAGRFNRLEQWFLLA